MFAEYAHKDSPEGVVGLTDYEIFDSVTAAIRALDNKELASIPIIALTAYAFSEDRQRALDNGMNGHIAKPIDSKQLTETLVKFLGDK